MGPVAEAMRQAYENHDMRAQALTPAIDAQGLVTS
jgi:hypothetical protein